MGAGGDALAAALAVGRSIDVRVAMAKKGDQAQDLARAGRHALATSNAAGEVEPDEGGAVMPWERQVNAATPCFLSG